jgi:hypothetical protein
MLLSGDWFTTGSLTWSIEEKGEVSISGKGRAEGHIKGNTTKSIAPIYPSPLLTEEGITGEKTSSRD